MPVRRNTAFSSDEVRVGGRTTLHLAGRGLTGQGTETVSAAYFGLASRKVFGSTETNSPEQVGAGAGGIEAVAASLCWTRPRISAARSLGTQSTSICRPCS